MDCAKCGEPMRMTDKNSFSGRDIREYKCDRCGHEDWEDNGEALWQILHNDREEFEAAQALEATAEAPVAPPVPEQKPVISMWNRIMRVFRRCR
jgi:DNA-directed RNA polymerase subunit RPC12/RpoP